LEPGTPEFFAAADIDRYQRAQPWMDEAINFAAYANRQVLEVGHGMCGDLMRFARAGASVSGIDLTPRHHQLAAQRFALAGIPVDLRLGDAEAMPFDDASFDLVYSFGVIHHSPDQEAIVAEMRRVLRPGGRIIVGLYHRWSLSMAELVAYEARHGRLFRQSWRRTLSTIEARDHSDACPLVQLHTRRSVGRLLRGFENVSIDARGLWTRSLPGCGPAMTRTIERRLGWFLIATATKPAR
jgi:SAM-dependent methyltransferase